MGCPQAKENPSIPEAQVSSSLQGLSSRALLARKDWKSPLSPAQSGVKNTLGSRGQLQVILFGKAKLPK